MSRPEHEQRTELKTRVIRISVLCLFWVAVTAVLVFTAGQGWKELAVASLPSLGLFVTLLLALRFGPYAVAGRATPSAEEPTA